MWQKVYDELKAKGLNPYAPGQHRGLCEERYCVIRESSQLPSIRSSRTGYRLMDVIVFVPIASYLAVKPYVREIKGALKGLPFLYATGNETPVIADNEVKAYTTSVEYRILKKLEG